MGHVRLAILTSALCACAAPEASPTQAPEVDLAVHGEDDGADQFAADLEPPASVTAAEEPSGPPAPIEPRANQDGSLTLGAVTIEVAIQPGGRGELLGKFRWQGGQVAELGVQSGLSCVARVRVEPVPPADDPTLADPRVAVVQALCDPGRSSSPNNVFVALVTVGTDTRAPRVLWTGFGRSANRRDGCGAQDLPVFHSAGETVQRRRAVRQEPAKGRGARDCEPAKPVSEEVETVRLN